MQLRKINNFEEQIDKIKKHLPEYLLEHNLDVTNGRKICCLDPHHDDRNPSMSMFHAEEGYPLVRCHSCGVTMDIFNCASVLDNFPSNGPQFVEKTVSYFANKYGIELQYTQLSEDEVYELNTYQAYEAVADYITSQLEEMNELQLEEINRRGYDKRLLITYRVGICNNLEKMIQHLVTLGYTRHFLTEIDVLNSRIFNPNTLIYTISDSYGRPIAFISRNLLFTNELNDNGDFINGPKFINTSTSVLKRSVYKKNETLYLFHIAKKQASAIYVVEGNSDALSLHNHGITSAVGICGLNFSEAHLNTLRRNSVYDVVICFDNDEAGNAKAKKIIKDILNHVKDIKVRFVFLPIEYDDLGNKLKSDPDSFLRNHNAEEFLNLEKVDPFEWMLREYESQSDMNPEDVCMTMIPIIVAEQSVIRREKMISYLSLYTGYSEKNIREEILRLENLTAKRIEQAKSYVVDELVNNLKRDPSGAETYIGMAMDSIYEIDSESKQGLLDTETRISEFLDIKAASEDPDCMNLITFGKDFNALNAALDGPLLGKVLFEGGQSNIGKTSYLVNLIWRLLENNNNIMCIFLSIDDQSSDIIHRFNAFDAAYRLRQSKEYDLFDIININKFARHLLYKDSIHYDVILEQKNIFNKKWISYAREDRTLLFDVSHGRTLDFIKYLLKHYSDKYPNRHIFFILDNLHLVNVTGDVSGREKYKYISNEIKSLAVNRKCTIISTVEYHKLPIDLRPTNNNIAESNSLVYDSNFIIHGFNELHGLGNKATAYFYDEYSSSNNPTKYPIIEFDVGKNKIASFKGTLYYKMWPEKAYYEEISEAEFKLIKEANQRSDIPTMDIDAPNGL